VTTAQLHGYFKMCCIPAKRPTNGKNVMYRPQLPTYLPFCEVPNAKVNEEITQYKVIFNFNCWGLHILCVEAVPTFQDPVVKIFPSTHSSIRQQEASSSTLMQGNQVHPEQ
jgi:hypothetical protein